MDDAESIIRLQVEAIRRHWDRVCDDPQLNGTERAILWNGAFLKPYALEGLAPDMAEI